MALSTIAVILGALTFAGEFPVGGPPLRLAEAAANCARTGQAIGVEDRCDRFGSVLDVYLPRALEGDPRAAVMVGLTFMDGLRITRQAAQWFLRAAEAGDRKGQYYLGLAHQRGEGGLERDPVKALAWFDLAAAQGSGIARSARTMLAREMTGDDIDRAAALAASLGANLGE